MDDLNTDKLKSQTATQKILLADLREIRGALDNDLQNQFLRRQMVRGFISYTEAHIFHLKSVVLFIKQLVLDVLRGDHPIRTRLSEFFCVDYSPEEIVLLREESLDVSDKGDIKIQPKFLQNARNIRFVQRCYLAAIKTGYTIDYSDDGWQSLQEVIRVRNRLTHPKSAEALTVTDEEINHVVKADEWYEHNAQEMMKAANERLEEFKALTEAFR